MAFTFGLGVTLLFPLRFGAAAATIEHASPPEILEAIAKHGVTHLGTAPTAYKAMLSEPPRDSPLMRDCPSPLDGALKTLRTCISAGEHLPEAIWRGWHERTGIAITDGIGATEMMHIFVSAAGEDIRPGATGKAVPGYEVSVLDPANQPLFEGVGRLAVKGPTGCRYLDDPRQAAYVQRGWNLTGDTFVRDDDGYFWYQARSDDMIISSGYNIAAPEVEEALLKHPAVSECAVVGVPDEARGMLVKAYVVTAAGSGEVTAGELQDFVKAEIAPYKYPRAIEFVAELPRTATGKLQRFRLREPHA